MPVAVTNPKRYAKLSKELASIDAAILELESGAQSATISTAGNSQSFTRVDLAKLQARRDRVNDEMLSMVSSGRPRLPMRSLYMNPT